MKPLKIFCLFTLLCVNVAVTVNAADNCDNFDPEPAHFKALYNDSKQLGKAICDSLGKTMDLDLLVGQYVEFANKIDKAVEENFKNSDYYNDLKIQIAHFKSLAGNEVDKGNLPTFKVAPSLSDLDGKILYFGFEARGWDTRGDVDKTSDKCTQVPSCEALLESFAVAINQYKEPYVRLSADATTKKIIVLRKAWDSYFENARSQTLWDALLTTKMEEDYLTQDRLVGPMQRQWFLVHPSVVIENVSDSVIGQETLQGLAVEWVGVNWWDKETSPIGIPFGVSLASIYSSRPNVDDAGHGVMMTFNNALSIGWADHGGDDGYYVSFDFLSLLTEKKERWKDYKKEIKELEFE